jgi:hypothetical protein
LSPDEHQRLDSWLQLILAELRPDDPLDTTHEPMTSGSISFFDDGWHRFSNGAHGTTMFDLIAELTGGVRNTKARTEALTWAKQFLTEHPGRGSWEGTGSEAAEAKAQRIAERARFALQRRIAIPGTPAEAYLTSRGISVREGMDALLGYMPDFDPGNYAEAGDLMALRQLLLTAKPAELSREGEIERLARLDPLDYEQERSASAARLGVRIGVLDELVEKLRQGVMRQARNATSACSHRNRLMWRQRRRQPASVRYSYEGLEEFVAAQKPEIEAKDTAAR